MSTSEVTLDFGRKERIGFEEAIFGQGKTTEQLTEICDRALERNHTLLVTRLSQAQLDALPARHQERTDYEPVSRTAFVGKVAPPAGPSRVAIAAAGSSDAFITREIQRTLAYHGHACTPLVDIGVAGIWRLLDKVELLKAHPVVIVVAGMDAALLTVVGGLVGSVVIGVPSSNGYGAARGGETALGAMLASCAPGALVMNIDNGYGAACAAIRVVRLLPR